MAESCRQHGSSEQTYYRWKAKYGREGKRRCEKAEATGRGKPEAEACGSRVEARKSCQRRDGDESYSAMIHGQDASVRKSGMFATNSPPFHGIENDWVKDAKRFGETVQPGK